ncbi:MAG: hypothetical protein ACLQUW_07860 [Desulfobaccales bacterium]
MIAAFLTYGFLALAIFYLQNLAFFPQMHLRLLALLLFYLGLRPSLALALALAVAMGVLQDSFAITPFGLHLGAALLVVGVARIFSQRLPQQRFGLQAAACLLAMVLQEVFLQTSLITLGYEGGLAWGQISHHAAEIVFTAVLGPLMCLLVLGLERFLGRYGWRPRSQQPGFYQPLA